MYDVDSIDFFDEIIEVDNECDHQTDKIYKYEVMQYTGLKDKNSIEIYEKDIVWDDYKEEYGLVVFERGKYLCEWETHADSLYNELDYIEVIGNVYEHKYLLEENDK